MPYDNKIKSLHEKRKSVEEKLNAVLERQLSKEGGKSTEALINAKASPERSLNNLAEKASSMGDIKVKVDGTENHGKAHSEGSSRDDSLENIADAEKQDKRFDEDTVDRSRDRRGSGINVSVITSTPLRSRSVSRGRNGENVVVITGNFCYSKMMTLQFSFYV